MNIIEKYIQYYIYCRAVSKQKKNQYPINFLIIHNQQLLKNNTLIITIKKNNKYYSKFKWQTFQKKCYVKNFRLTLVLWNFNNKIKKYPQSYVYAIQMYSYKFNIGGKMCPMTSRTIITALTRKILNELQLCLYFECKITLTFTFCQFVMYVCGLNGLLIVSYICLYIIFDSIVMFVNNLVVQLHFIAQVCLSVQFLVRSVLPEYSTTWYFIVSF
eukprot:TRINITY_DN6334_c0_g1_i12.p1 TRINITY_DN6334_c0_g1~~TRINITY_DN6334_c0_g1_i12.p1  ORF type:complete len:227 (-),score=-22.57 TRINITY_DN6334_c0_g1_i12:2285-2929(-)